MWQAIGGVLLRVAIWSLDHREEINGLVGEIIAAKKAQKAAEDTKK